MVERDFYEIGRLQGTVKSLLVELEDYEEHFSYCKSNPIQDMPKGGSGKSVYDLYLEGKVDLESRIERCRKEIEYQRKRVLRCIDEHVTDEDTALMLKYRFINNKNVEDIAQRMGYDRSTVYKRIKRFLKVATLRHS